MSDPLFSRAELAIEQSSLLREQRRSLGNDGDGIRARLRREMFANAMLRSEVRARREDKGEPAPVEGG